MSAFDRFAQEAVKAIDGETKLIGELADYIASMAQESKRVLAERAALADEAARLRADYGELAQAYDQEKRAAIQERSRLSAEIERLRAVLDSKEAEYHQAVDFWHNRAIAAEHENATLRALLDPALLRVAADEIEMDQSAISGEWGSTIQREEEVAVLVSALRAAADKLEVGR